MNRFGWTTLLLLGSLLTAAAVCRAQGRARIELDGDWQFRIDPEGVGETGEWHSAAVPFPRSIRVPGNWQAQGVGERSGILRNHYVGQAWYRRQVAIPADWGDKTVLLRVGGVLRRATVFVNGLKAGSHDGFTTPFDLDISAFVRPGSENIIAILVSNPGPAIAESPDMQKGSVPTGMLNYIGNWGGIYGSVGLEAAAPVRIDEVAIVPDIARNLARFRIVLRSRETEAARPVRVEVTVGSHTAAAEARIEPGRTTQTEVPLPIPNAVPWSPQRPHLYQAWVRLVENGRETDRVGERFGMREISIRGNVLLLNGKPLYLRGYGDDNVEVLSGTPPASKEVFLERLRLARGFGFNAVRFHSMTPVREYFEAADETGMLVMAELPAAYTMYVLPHREFLRRELERVLRVHRNHPSFLSLAFGNEFNLNWLKTAQEKAQFRETVEDFYRLAKSIDPNRVILSNDGLLLRPTDMASLYRDAPGDIPTVRHEFGAYYCSLPDPSLIGKFTGVIEPTWLEQKRKWVEDSGLANAYGGYLLNSQRLQQLGRKYQIERARTLAEYTGYHYWLIVDYPGGTGEGDSWEEGWLDYFWRPKNVTPREGRELNSPVLLMINAGVNDRTLWTTSTKRIEILASNYGEEEIEDGVLTWELRGAAGRVGGAQVTGIRAPLGSVGRIAGIAIGPVAGRTAQKLELIVTLKTRNSEYTNRWTFWAFPREGLLQRPDLPVVSNGVLVTSSLDAAAAKRLAEGGRVWLLAERGDKATFFPASGGAQGTMLPEHPALRGFPHEGFCDLQFFNLLEGGWNFPLDGWPRELVPIIGGVRTTSSFLSKQKNLSRTGYVFEVKAGPGSLLVSTLNLRQHLDDACPEAVYLFDRLLRYASGPDFHPAVTAGSRLLDRLRVRY
jgi:hypothetical protein